VRHDNNRHLLHAGSGHELKVLLYIMYIIGTN
jgi:hypothetical protein